MPSLVARAVAIWIRFNGTKRTLSSDKLTLAEVERLHIRPESFSPPKSLDRYVDFSVRLVNGWRVYIVTPRGGASRRAVYTHGGGWEHEIVSFH